ncbi:hypothetical protein [Nocardia sp. NPDC051570]
MSVLDLAGVPIEMGEIDARAITSKILASACELTELHVMDPSVAK